MDSAERAIEPVALELDAAAVGKAQRVRIVLDRLHRHELRHVIQVAFTQLHSIVGVHLVSLAQVVSVNLYERVVEEVKVLVHDTQYKVR